jgi:hypothetical protein
LRRRSDIDLNSLHESVYVEFVIPLRKGDVEFVLSICQGMSLCGGEMLNLYSHLSGYESLWRGDVEFVLSICRGVSLCGGEMLNLYFPSVGV